MNLLKETIDELINNGLSVEDVEWVGNDEIFTDWENFVEVANVEYNDGFGGQRVATDLKVVGKDWWLERNEHAGSEWWELKKLPSKPDKNQKLQRVVGEFWTNLVKMNSK